MTTTAIIPARYASSRFPGKPLAADTGKYLIQHVYERVSDCRRIDSVVVATDDGRIVEAIRTFGGQVRLTRADHPSGTDRVAEAAGALRLADDDLVLNVQGDEPEINAGDLDRLVDRVTESRSGREIGTLAAPFDDGGPAAGPGSPLDPNCVKVVVDRRQRALYFSRCPIPYSRKTAGGVDRPSNWLLHLGVYAFRMATLRKITADRIASGGPLAERESLEQLRWLENGFEISVVIAERCFVGIDTPEDYAAFVARRAREGNKVGTNVE